MGGHLHRKGTSALALLTAAALATAAMAGPSMARTTTAAPAAPAARTATTATTATTARATIQGRIVATRTYDFTITTAGRPNDSLARMISYATALGAKDFKYVYGGGHAHAGTPTDGGFDCSGSVAAVLAAGGLWPKGGAVGSDLGLVQELKSRGLIASGPGTGPDQLTLYDHPGKTIEMSIDGRIWGVGGDNKGGPGWVDDAMVGKSDLREYHILPSALHASHADSDDVTFYYQLNAAGYKLSKELTVGARVSVSYSNGALGMLNLDSITNTGGTPFRG